MTGRKLIAIFFAVEIAPWMVGGLLLDARLWFGALTIALAAGLTVITRMVVPE